MTAFSDITFEIAEVNIVLILFLNFSGKVVKIEEDPLFSEQKRFRKSKRGAIFLCGKCDYVATKSFHLKTHIKSKHEGVRFPCDQCDYVATGVQSLKLHIENKHEGVRLSL